MKSKWCELRGEAVRLRKRGLSVRKIESRLGIPRSTLSGWFKGIRLSPRQREKLLKKWKLALVNARKKAVLWHNRQKEIRLEDARQQALRTLGDIDVYSPSIQELALAILYMAEGRKKAAETSLGSSDPLILKFFLAVLKRVHKIDENKVSCTLYLRADQNSEKLKKYWAKELELPLNSFAQIYKDKRTIGSKTYPHYKGVCDVRYGDVAVKRKLLFLSRLFCERISGGIGALSSVG